VANDAVEWLATISRHCRKLIELAGLAIRDREEYETPAAKKALREALTVHKDALLAALPEDFPASRRGDLARHIGFCDPSDWYDIVLFDVPDLLAKAELTQLRCLLAKQAGLRSIFTRAFGHGSN